MKTSGSAIIRAPPAAAARTQRSASFRLAALSSEASICTAAARNSIGRDLQLPIQKHRTGRIAQHVLRRAAEDHIDDAAVAIGADEKKIVIAVDQILDNFLLRVAAT